MVTTTSRPALKTLLIGVTLICALSARADQWAPQPPGKEGFICGANGHPSLPHVANPKPGAPEAMLAVKWITATIGIKPNFEVLQDEFSRKVGAYAIIRGGRRYVVYDSEDAHWQAGRPNWRDLGVMAHEIGHHVAGHTATKGDRWGEELEADRFAGFALGRLGADLDQALLWTADLNEEPTKTHPPRKDRVEAAKEGWNHAQLMKKREGPACTRRWMGEPVSLAFRTCRVATVCTPEERVRIACKDILGQWVWRD
ncbi:MAG: hypothetical protein H6907_09960 [Hyphomicrobiales bacterium]|nr:hypothetical protein [Hyphomicrobiales bacterium]MCP5372043.1 hypothetical protein [Hyphomicrobiales bacterium]